MTDADSPSLGIQSPFFPISMLVGTTSKAKKLMKLVKRGGQTNESGRCLNEGVLHISRLPVDYTTKSATCPELHCESVRPLQGPKSPKSGKEGFGVKNLPFPSGAEMGALSEKKKPLSLWSSPVEEWGFFDSKRPFLGHWEMEAFF